MKNGKKPPLNLTHQIAELLTLAIGELYIAQTPETTGPELQDTITRVEEVLLRIREPIYSLMIELAEASEYGPEHITLPRRGADSLSSGIFSTSHTLFLDR